MAAVSTKHLIDQFRRTFDGAAWHGPNLLSTLRDLPPEKRTARIGDSHNPAELVHHMKAWRRFAIRKLTGDKDYEVSEQDNFPIINSVDDEQWQHLLDELAYTQHRLLVLLEQIDERQLERQVPGRDYNFSTLLHGIVHHDVYHLGQIALLKKGDL